MDLLYESITRSRLVYTLDFRERGSSRVHSAKSVNVAQFERWRCKLDVTCAFGINRRVKKIETLVDICKDHEYPKSLTLNSRLNQALQTGLNRWNHENSKCMFLELIRPETRQPLVLDFFIFGKRILIAANPQWRSHSIINIVIQDLFKVIHDLGFSWFQQTCKSHFRHTSIYRKESYQDSKKSFCRFDHFCFSHSNFLIWERNPDVAYFHDILNSKTRRSCL